MTKEKYVCDRFKPQNNLLTKELQIYRKKHTEVEVEVEDHLCKLFLVIETFELLIFCSFILSTLAASRQKFRWICNFLQKQRRALQI